MAYLEKIMITYYKKFGRKNLSWRKRNVSPYAIWVSEVMLAQTQVSKVMKYYDRFIVRFPNVKSLAQASWNDFLPYFEGLGYYQRGRNMLKTARIVVEKYKSEFPQEKQVLLSLPGIGEYTASAILCFAYHQQEIPVDINVKKVFGRYFYGTKNATIFHNKAVLFFTHKPWIASAALMDFANDICIRRPMCSRCPLKNDCVYFSQDGQKEKGVISHISPQKFPNNKAQVFLWLHRDHKIYFSSKKYEFDIFRLSHEYNTREKIKKYFKTQFGLTLSVRPPHKKVYHNNVPTFYVFAQILSGDNQFHSFVSDTIDEYSP